MTIILDGTKGTTTPGLYSSTTFTGTYADGIVVDYTTGLGRISVGTSDGLAFYNAGVATTELMRIDSSGNVGIGTSSPTSGMKTDIAGYVGSSFNAASNDAVVGSYSFINTNASAAANPVRATIAGGRENSAWGAYLAFATSTGTSAATEKMRIDSSGNLLVGTTTAGNATVGMTWLSPAATSSPRLQLGHATGTASGGSYLDFQYNGSSIGTITQNGTTGVLYNLTSDYRLKNNPEPVTGAKEFVMALQPKKWQWWDGSGEGVGFIAHEFMEVAKYSGNGEKDAVDENGNPVYQSIQPSSSEVMANLVSLLQEQQALITQLQADVAALKGQ